MRGENRKLYRVVSFVILFAACSILGVANMFSKRLLNELRNSSDIVNQEPIALDYHPDNSSEHPFCKNPTIHEFPNDFVPFEHPSGLLIHGLIFAYLLAAITVVCDEFFVESLSKISIGLNLKEDVAGATFMAAGTSAPELFTSIIGVLVAKSDIGTGTIVGSAIFNVLFIIGICSLAAKQVLKIDFYPISRDCLFYAISLAGLLIVLYDGEITLIESLSLIVLYSFYILVMYFNPAIEKWTKQKVNKQEEKQSSVEAQIEPVEQFALKENENKESAEEEEEAKPFNPFQRPDKSLQVVFWIILFPANVLFYYTIPDVRRKTFDKFGFHFLSFIVSTIYVGLLTYLMVWMVVIIAYRVSIPDTVAGLTVLAFSTSLPEVVSSIIITRKGKGEMAMSNSIGSNIFDILICLGVPWVIETARSGANVRVYSKGIFYSSAILFGSIIILLGCFIIFKWKMNKKFGVTMFVLWTIVTVITCLFEYDVFGKVSVPDC